ncbi:hypothetical protein MTBBW1_140005 [Desulfamplus magnetovallimortis]|uniref:Uncharacterized protein n=1 Tax=Desulfamplus magnetovallimortis TaxID=1246637 RepID=A0A1W1H7W5_9BACT|nr:hypothetical protein MTBBW1_140005 [Desulfamplus magnetovallimortis]
MILYHHIAKQKKPLAVKLCKGFLLNSKPSIKKIRFLGLLHDQLTANLFYTRQLLPLNPMVTSPSFRITGTFLAPPEISSMVSRLEGSIMTSK